MSYSVHYLNEAAEILSKIDKDHCEQCVTELVRLKKRGGRLFVLGVGGSAANASHAVNDFRKIAHIEAYAPTDNISELTARTNDDGWATVFEEWLQGSRLNANDTLLILSVGGGDIKNNLSVNLVKAVQLAQKIGTPILGILGKDGGYAATAATSSVIIPTVNIKTVTPHAEAFQSVIWHLWVTHPSLQG